MCCVVAPPLLLSWDGVLTARPPACLPDCVHSPQVTDAVIKGGAGSSFTATTTSPISPGVRVEHPIHLCPVPFRSIHTHAYTLHTVHPPTPIHILINPLPINNNNKQRGEGDEQYDVIVAAFVALRKLRRTRELEAMVGNLGAWNTSLFFFFVGFKEDL